MKTIAHRIPLGPSLVYLYILFVRRAFLDGAAGMNYARMRWVYEMMIRSKMAAAREEARGRLPGATLDSNRDSKAKGAKP